eukprot:421079-Pleurochrysis_carterae.AAC.3
MVAGQAFADSCCVIFVLHAFSCCVIFVLRASARVPLAQRSRAPGRWAICARPCRSGAQKRTCRTESAGTGPAACDATESVRANNGDGNAQLGHG